MVCGQEWTYVEELVVAGKTTSHICCKSCGHTFHGNATRIKEHLFNVGVNGNGCISPLGDIHSRLYKYVAKLKANSSQVKKKTPQGIRCEVDAECLVENMHDGEEALRDHVSPSVGQNLYAQSSHAASISGGHGNASASRVSKDNPLQNAFDKQSMLELHLK